MKVQNKSQEIKEKAKKHLSPVLTRVTELVVEKAKGARFWTADGDEYIDFVSGVAVNAVGHANDAMVQAIKKQAESFIHFGLNYGYYESAANLAEKIAEITPGNLDTVFFANSGGEAIDGALKLARAATGRPGIIAFEGSFHGRTLGATAITASSSKYRKYYEPILGEVYHAPYPYPSQLKGVKEEEIVPYCLHQLQKIFDLRIDPSRVAAVVIEPVMGEGGYFPAPVEFLQELRKITEKHGILLIFDEVQTGFRSTGKMFAAEHSGVTPDIMVLAKALSGGMPLGAIVASRELHEKWPIGGHGSTFGGNPISCAAALANINVIEEEKLVDRSRDLGAKIVERLKESLNGLPGIKEIHGLGMMIGIEFHEDFASHAVPLIKQKCLEHKLLIMNCGVQGQTIRLMLPLNINEEDLHQGLSILEDAIKDTL
ncbi:aminotransferase class III-fold pyridoxal phosphate-dependent enzyme [Neobacillus sp. PS3-34]|uniref:aspartate aminotransferase family protein n=1 Tax=Neobacillus sp. PS3-34 TaxID=3070678 RepID=UPI0027DF3CDD|nr:aminotransferase class III-fold pyridoxal phosphate-dependent enzyme [Neobacillus sp. PS3-34]WML48436.1 aminotransferase class III-fold pyridoxal phosphate-dependent enzyme [Neobacillus sp. PS3-34]